MYPKCEGCRKCDEHFYWHHVEPTKKRFFKVILSDFSKYLNVPRKFAKHFKDFTDLQEDVKLQGPSGKKWSVKLNTTETDTCFTDGWNKFVKDHWLGIGDFLVFRYTGNSCFKVRIFDTSGCEKEHAYFIKDDSSVELLNHGDQECGSFGSDNSTDEPQSSQSIEGKSRVGKQLLQIGWKKILRSPSDHQNEDLTISTKEEEDDDDDGEEEDGEEEDKKEEEEQVSNSSKTDRNCVNQVVKVAGLSKKRPLSHVQSSRRPATAQEKQRALNQAKSLKSSRPAFIAVMRQNNVYKTFTLVIPSKFAAENLPKCHENMILQLSNGKIWPVNYLLRCKVAKFGLGWRKFARDNILEVDDVCRFELTGTKSSSKLVLEVQIFPAVSPAEPSNAGKQKVSLNH